MWLQLGGSGPVVELRNSPVALILVLACIEPDLLLVRCWVCENDSSNVCGKVALGLLCSRWHFPGLRC